MKVSKAIGVLELGMIVHGDHRLSDVGLPVAQILRNLGARGTQGVYHPPVPCPVVQRQSQRFGDLSRVAPPETLVARVRDDRTLPDCTRLVRL